MSIMSNKGIILTKDLINRAPKVLLHDHLDGGLRPETIIDLAHQTNFELPESDPGRPAVGFHCRYGDADLNDPGRAVPGNRKRSIESLCRSKLLSCPA